MEPRVNLGKYYASGLGKAMLALTGLRVPAGTYEPRRRDVSTSA